MSSTCRMNRLSPPKREGLSLSCVTPNSQPGALLLQHWLSIKVQKLDSIPIRGIDPTGLIYPIPLTHPLRDLRWICKHRDELGKGTSCKLPQFTIAICVLLGKSMALHFSKSPGQPGIAILCSNYHKHKITTCHHGR